MTGRSVGGAAQRKTLRSLGSSPSVPKSLLRKRIRKLDRELHYLTRHLKGNLWWLKPNKIKSHEAEIEKLDQKRKAARIALKQPRPREE